MKSLLAPFLFLGLGAGSLPALSAEEADASAILAAVRENARLQNVSFEGFLRKGRINSPIKIAMEGEVIRFSLSRPSEEYEFRIRKDGHEIVYRKGEEDFAAVEAKRLEKGLRMTDVTIEDLALRFLYWEDVKLLGSDTIKGQDCWQLHLTNPGETGPYASVEVWVEKKQLALMQVNGLNEEGERIRRFRIDKVQHLESGFFPQQMVVEEYKPESGRLRGWTYIELKLPKGLRSDQPTRKPIWD
ncbi:MAG: outer membrane lipoprotein-sorting protein [Verrucomicrobiota bacterium]